MRKKEDEKRQQGVLKHLKAIFKACIHIRTETQMVCENVFRVAVCSELGFFEKKQKNKIALPCGI